MIVKRVMYAYPSSPLATKMGHRLNGCYVVVLHDTKKQTDTQTLGVYKGKDHAYKVAAQRPEPWCWMWEKYQSRDIEKASEK